MRYLIAFLLFASFSVNAASDYYIRADGGTFAQCDGTTDTPYAQTSARAHCAWNHPFVALPPINNEHHVAPRIAGGDTLHIGSGSYRMGYGATPEASVCYSNAMYDCKMQPVPAGTAANPTKIIGACTNPPELWADKGAYSVLDLTRSSHVEVSCLEITDHDSCIINHCTGNPLACTPAQVDRCMSGDAFGSIGLIASDATNVKLNNINIHGMGNAGVRAGRLTDWNVKKLRLFANGFVGWDGDIRNGVSGADTSNHGNMLFDEITIAWSGCGEKYPTGEIYGCWDQDEGGYGDGLGTGPTEGTWKFTNSMFYNNASDGLDMLYMSADGHTLVDHVLAYGNAGNQIKVAGNALVTNSVVKSNCSSEFSEYPPNNYSGPYIPAQFVGKYNMELSGNCRASGDAVATAHTGNSTIELVNNTIASQSNCLVTTTGMDKPNTKVILANNILNGNNNVDWQTFATGGGARGICLFYGMNSDWSGAPNTNVMFKNNLVWGVRNNDCPEGSLCMDPMLTDNSVVTMDPMPLRGSPAIGAGDATFCQRAGLSSGCNIGAVQGGGQTQPPPPPPPQEVVPEITVAQGTVKHTFKQNGELVAKLVANTGVSISNVKGMHWEVTRGTDTFRFPNSNQLTVTVKR